MLCIFELFQATSCGWRQSCDFSSIWKAPLPTKLCYVTRVNNSVWTTVSCLCWCLRNFPWPSLSLFPALLVAQVTDEDSDAALGAFAWDRVKKVCFFSPFLVSLSLIMKEPTLVLGSCKSSSAFSLPSPSNNQLWSRKKQILKFGHQWNREQHVAVKVQH